MNHDIYVRAHTRPREQQRNQESSVKRGEPKWVDYALIFDCESRITADQTLTFGFWRFCELRAGRYIAVEEGIFHDLNISDREINIIRAFAKENPADTAHDGCDRIRIYSTAKFISDVLGIAIQAKAFIVCFNAGFDLSRIAVDWETAENGGWSLILSQWRDRKTQELKPSKFFPRIVVKALNSKTAIIHSTRPPMFEPKKKDDKVKHWPAARFLDIRTLLWALRNRSYSLESACKEFKTEHQKIGHTPSGTVTVEEIEYARNDVACTVDLLNAAKEEFDLHPIAAGPDRMFSPASVAKSYLEELNISYPSEKVDNLAREYGIFMQAYFGGRAECRIRNWAVPVCPVDFMSQYPTVNELLDNWSVLTADQVEFRDATETVRELLSQITLERCFDRTLWRRFKFFALVYPANDIFPVRLSTMTQPKILVLTISPAKNRSGLPDLTSLHPFC